MTAIVDPQNREFAWKGRPGKTSASLVSVFSWIFVAAFLVVWGWDSLVELSKAIFKGGDARLGWWEIGQLITIVLGIAVIPYWNGRVKRNTCYEITNTGVTFIYSGFPKQRVEVPFSRISMVSLTNYDQDRASIVLNCPEGLWGISEGKPRFMLGDGNNEGHVVLKSVENAKHVQALIKKRGKNWHLTRRSRRSLRSLGHSALRTCSGMASPFSPKQALRAECRLTWRYA